MHIESNIEINTMTRTVDWYKGIKERSRWCDCFIPGLIENHLRVTLIKSGDSVIIIRVVAILLQFGWNRDNIVPYRIFCKGRFLYDIGFRKSKE